MSFVFHILQNSNENGRYVIDSIAYTIAVNRFNEIKLKNGGNSHLLGKNRGIMRQITSQFIWDTIFSGRTPHPSFICLRDLRLT